MSVAQKYAERYPFIKVLSQDHSGISIARNLGLTQASGYWISFLDADDFIEPDMFRLMLQAIENTSREVEGCICGYYTQKDGIITPYAMDASNVLTSKEIIKAMFTDEAIKGFLFTRLFKADLIKDMSFDGSLKLCEDLAFQTQLFSRKELRMAVVPKPLYHYIQNEQSVTMHKSFFSSETFVYKPSYDKIRDYVQDEYVMESYNDILEYSMYTLLNSYRNTKSPETLREIRLMQKELKKNDKYQIRKTKRRMAFELAPVIYSRFMS